MATERSQGGEVSQRLLDYYDRMTRGGYLGLVTIEHAFVSPDGKASPRQLSVSKEDDIPGLSKLADTIHQNGVPAIMQISHAGLNTHKLVTGHIPLGPDMPLSEIERIKAAFVAAAVRAQKAGFDGVEVHCAHGYLLNEFYSPLTNHRNDAYSGDSLDGRTRLQSEILRSIRETCGPDLLLSLRWGASDYMNGGSTVQEVPEAAKYFEQAGADMLSISGGLCGYTRTGATAPGWFAELSRAAKSTVHIPVMLTGGITSKAQADIFIQQGDADLIGVARAFLRDPDLPKKMLG